MDTLLCCIIKNENRYINEYVEYYRNLGVSKIVLYDNNAVDGENPEEYLKKHISDGFVDIVNLRGLETAQLPAYNHCYNVYRNNYDWLMFFDCDEFLTLVKHDNISDFLSQERFNGYDVIHLNWMIYGDNDMLYYENRPVQERFTTPAPFDLTIGEYPFNYHVKSIVRGHLDVTVEAFFLNPHTPGALDYPSNPLGMPLKCCDQFGLPCFNMPYLPYNFSEAYIKHYVTKSADEYASRIMRGNSDVPMSKELVDSLVKRFFVINGNSKEKVEIIKNRFIK